MTQVTPFYPTVKHKISLRKSFYESIKNKLPHEVGAEYDGLVEITFNITYPSDLLLIIHSAIDYGLKEAERYVQPQY